MGSLKKNCFPVFGKANIFLLLFTGLVAVLCVLVFTGCDGFKDIFNSEPAGESSESDADNNSDIDADINPDNNVDIDADNHEGGYYADNGIPPLESKDVAPATPDITLSPTETIPGNHVIIKAGPFDFKDTPTIELDSNLTAELSKPYRDGDYLVLFLGINYVTRPGVYNLDFSISGTGEEPLNIKRSLTLKEPGFDFSRFSVPPTVTDSWTAAQLAKDRERVREARAQTEQVYLWTGPFIWPVEGRISSDFGAVRVINNGPPSHHSGIDIALPEGTPFVAANRGVVTLAEFLLASGNAVFIDHGLRLSSAYLHMHEIFVEEGQLVEQGEVIGTIGTTGFSSGPHLHWSVYIGNTPVSPYPFMEGLIPQFPE